MFFAQTGPVSGATCCSSARQAPSRPPVGPRPGAGREEQRSGTLPRNPWSRSLYARERALAPTETGNSLHGGRRDNRPRFDACCGPAPPRPKPVLLWNAQTTRVRPTLAPESCCRGRVAVKCCSGVGKRLLFFNPTDHRVAGNANGAGQTAPAGTLLLGAQNQFALCFGIAIRARIGGGAPPTVAAAKALASVGPSSLADDVRALAVRTGNRTSDHGKKTRTSLPNHRALSHYPRFNGSSPRFQYMTRGFNRGKVLKTGKG